MGYPYWPLFDLRVRTPRLELRLPTDDDLVGLVRVAEGGIHDPATMPFTTPWTDTPPPRFQRETLQWWWSARATWRSDDWRFTGAVFVEGEPVGVQDLSAKRFSQLRTVETASWLGRAHQGRGLGKEMRAAVLHLAFAGLGATEAYSGAFSDNAASLGTSRAVGYSPNGTHLELRRGKPAPMIDLRLDRAAWLARRRDDIEVVGLESCRDMFGAA
ncbi:MAG TPA: GNAT family protein [Acidimicrobiales bacterium]|jgi:RimJ/RimL family protein N-acetyltransferase